MSILVTAHHALVPMLLATVASTSPAPRPAVPFVEVGDVGCHWTMHDKEREKWIRGGIGQGDEDPILDLVDSAFDSWSNSEEHAIEVSAGDSSRRLPATAWASPSDGETPGSIGFYMDADLRQMIGGATSLQIWKGGKAVYSGLLSATPSAAELDSCVRPPKSEDSDEE